MSPGRTISFDLLLFSLHVPHPLLPIDNGPYQENDKVDSKNNQKRYNNIPFRYLDPLLVAGHAQGLPKTQKRGQKCERMRGIVPRLHPKLPLRASGTIVLATTYLGKHQDFRKHCRNDGIEPQRVEPVISNARQCYKLIRSKVVFNTQCKY